MPYSRHMMRDRRRRPPRLHHRERKLAAGQEARLLPADRQQVRLRQHFEQSLALQRLIAAARLMSGRSRKMLTAEPSENELPSSVLSKRCPVPIPVVSD